MRSIVRSAGLLIAAAAVTACSALPASTQRHETSPAVSPTSAEAAACPSTSRPVLPDLADGMVPADAVSSYLEAGGDPTSLASALFDRGWGSPTSTVVWTDVDGDGRLDFAAGLTGAPDAEAIAGDGSVTLWLCRGGTYLRTEIALPRPDYGLPAIRLARDLTADGLPELIVAYPRCGAHTCFAQYAVLQWDGSGMVDRFQGASDDMPTPDLVIEADDAQAPAAIEITATGIGSVGAGPYRVWSRSWTWDGEAMAFVPGDPVIEPPRYRIHAIHDADDAYRRGDLSTALSLYQRAIDDDDLLDWPSAGERRQELAAYAAFRRVLALLTADEAVNARAEVNRWPSAAGRSAEAYAGLARLLLSGYADSELREACDAATTFARENPDAVLAPLDFGYANRTYAAEDICPILGP